MIVDETARYGEDAQSLGPLTAEWRLAKLETMTGSGTWLWSVRDGVVLWSESLLDLFGIPRGTPLDYAQYRSLLHPDDVAMIEETLATALRTLEPFSYTHRMVLGDRRTERVFECFGEVFADAAGRAVAGARHRAGRHRGPPRPPGTGVPRRPRPAHRDRQPPSDHRVARRVRRPGGRRRAAARRHRQLQGHQRPPRPRRRRPGDPGGRPHDHGPAGAGRPAGQARRRRVRRDHPEHHRRGRDGAGRDPVRRRGPHAGRRPPRRDPGHDQRGRRHRRRAAPPTSRPRSPTPTSRSTRRNGWAATGRGCSPPASTRRPRGGCRCCSGSSPRWTRAR